MNFWYLEWRFNKGKEFDTFTVEQMLATHVVKKLTKVEGFYYLFNQPGLGIHINGLEKVNDY